MRATTRRTGRNRNQLTRAQMVAAAVAAVPPCPVVPVNSVILSATFTLLTGVWVIYLSEPVTGTLAGAYLLTRVTSTGTMTKRTPVVLSGSTATLAAAPAAAQAECILIMPDVVTTTGGRFIASLVVPSNV